MVYSLMGIFSGYGADLWFYKERPHQLQNTGTIPSQMWEYCLSFASESYAPVPTHKQMLEHSYFHYFKYTSICL